jgi:hypothetical protein
MTKAEFIAAFDALLGGRRDCFAEGYPSPDNPTKYRWVHRDDPVTPAVFTSHLMGDVAIALYQLDVADEVSWIAMDFDGDRDQDDPFAQAYAEARAQQAAFTAVGVLTHLERSRSGAGVHLWGFLETPVPARIARAALFPYVRDGATVDKLYPVQTKLTAAKPVGNHLALPFFGKAVKHGNSSFLADDGTALSPRDALPYLHQHRIPASLLEELARQHPTAGLPSSEGGEGVALLAADVAAEPTGFLKLISSYGCSFVRYVVKERATLREPLWYAGLQIATQYANGRRIAHAISEGHPGYDPHQTNQKFDHALTQPRIGCQWIHQHYPHLACRSCPMKAPHWKARKTLLEIATTDTTGLQRVGSGAADLERIRDYDRGQRSSGVTWGLRALDDVMRMRSSEYVIFGARPSMGKTAFILDRAISLASRDIPAFLFSAETGELGIRDRLLANLADVDSRLLRGEGARRLYPTEWTRLEAAAARLADLPLYVDYATQDPDQMLATIEQALLDSRVPIDSPFVTFFDYLQFGMKAAGESKFEAVSRLSLQFKYLAKVSERPTVVLSQLRREDEGEDGDMTSLRDSGNIEQDADTIMLLSGERIEGGTVPRRIKIPKQRDGVANMTVPVRLQQATGRFEDLAAVQVENPFGDEQ